MIITFVGLDPFLLAINLDIVSSSNVFSTLIYVFRCKDTTFILCGNPFLSVIHYHPPLGICFYFLIIENYIVSLSPDTP